MIPKARIDIGTVTINQQGRPIKLLAGHYRVNHNQRPPLILLVGPWYANFIHSKIKTNLKFNST